MTVSIIVCIGNEQETTFQRHDPIEAALQSYCTLADQVIVMNGHPGTILDKLHYFPGKEKIEVHNAPWPYSWVWDQLPLQLNRALKFASGDWVIRCDIDYIFHERDIKPIKQKLASLAKATVATFQKWSLVTHHAIYEKGPVPLAINRKLTGDSIQFGLALNASTDLCYPIIVDGVDSKGVPFGTYDKATLQHTGLPVYNYDCTFRPRSFEREDFWRFSQAYHAYFHRWPFGSTKTDAFKRFKDMMKGRLAKCTNTNFTDHPVYIKPLIQQLTPNKFGYNMWQ